MSEQLERILKEIGWTVVDGVVVPIPKDDCPAESGD